VHTAQIDKYASPWYYPNNLLIDVRHTTLLGWLAVEGVVLVVRRLMRSGSDKSWELGYLLVWALGLLAVFSLFVARVNPIELIPKQTNYMTIFLAPLAVLGGFTITSLRPAWVRWLTFACYAFPSVILAGLLQQSVRSFTVNSRPTVALAREHPEKQLYVMTNAFRRQQWENLVSGPSGGDNLRSLSDLKTSEGAQWVVIDPQTLGWGASDPDSIDELPGCWIKDGSVRPDIRLSAGSVVVSAISDGADMFPTSVRSKVRGVTGPLQHPSPAVLYVVPAGCPAQTGPVSKGAQ
jgi:hypothetical protein